MLYFDPVYLLFALPGLILALLVSFYTKSTFARFSRIKAYSGMSGAEAARKLLFTAGVYDVKIEKVQGFLSDHYDPASRTLRLSPDVYEKNSLSSIGVACHEAGHAIQHAAAYKPLHLRSAMVPITNFCTGISYFFLMIGLMLPKLMLIGAVLFSVAVFFSLVTLPVEWDASARAKRLMVTSGIVSPDEGEVAGTVLNAAFLTYVATAVNALLILLYYLSRADFLGGGGNND